MTTVIAAFAVLLIFGSTSFAKNGSKFNFDLGYNGLYESNIFHSFEDSLETSAMVNRLSTEASWQYKTSRNFKFRIDGYFDLDMYSGYSNRNKATYGVRVTPTYRYNKRAGRLRLEADIARRNKDLVNDAGLTLARTLVKTQMTFGINHRYDFNKLRTEQTFYYYSDDYRDTVTLKSYDYDGFGAELNFGYQFSEKWESEFTYELNSRAYSELRTYTLLLGAGLGNPSEIREFNENTFGVSLKHNFSDKSDVEFEVEYTDRNDNYENYYGFDQMQYKVKFDVQLIKSNQTKFSLRYKTKDYNHYKTSHTKAIDPNATVDVEYADFKFENDYQMSDMFTLNFYVRNYNKVSNDFSFDYRDLTAGFGFRLSY